MRGLYGFGAKAPHQPVGMIGPATIAQEPGGCQCRHLLHCWSPFGFYWYITIDFSIFSCALAPAAAPVASTATPACSTLRRDVVLTLSSLTSIGSSCIFTGSFWNDNRLRPLVPLLRTHCRARDHRFTRTRYGSREFALNTSGASVRWHLIYLSAR